MSRNRNLCVIVLIVIKLNGVTSLECIDGKTKDSNVLPQSTKVCTQGLVCYGRSTKSDYYNSYGVDIHIQNIYKTYGCQTADYCADRSGRNVKSQGGGHFSTTYHYCCCTDRCTSGDEVEDKNYTLCANVRDPSEGVAPTGQLQSLELLMTSLLLSLSLVLANF